jgi:hypothetical protein
VRRLDQDQLKAALNARRSGRQMEAPYLRLLSERRAGWVNPSSVSTEKIAKEKPRDCKAGAGT